MSIQSLSIQGFRNLHTQSLEFHPKFNLILGENASGKTSFLEALYYLSRLKSFRQKDALKLIQENDTFFRLIANIHSGIENHKDLLGIECSKDRFVVKLTGETLQQRSILAKTLPCLYIDPETGKLLTDSPKFRRQFLDWGLFQKEASYHRLWQQFERLLKQRNAALKNRSSHKVLDSLDEPFSRYGIMLSEKRSEFATQLIEKALPFLLGLLDESYLWTLEYKRGFSGEFKEELLHSRERDYQIGFTRSGPHRADFTLKVNGKNAGEVLSRGQIKLASIALTMAQIVIFQKVHNDRDVVLLMDDMSAELDRAHRQLLLDAFRSLPVQLFITCLEKEEFPELSPLLSEKSLNCYEIHSGLLKKVV